MPAGNPQGYTTLASLKEGVRRQTISPEQAQAIAAANGWGADTNIVELQSLFGQGGGTQQRSGPAIVTREVAANPAMERAHALQLLSAGRGLEQGDFGMLQGPGMRTIQSIPELARRLGPNPMLGDVRQQAGAMLGPSMIGAFPNPLLLQAELLRKRR